MKENKKEIMKIVEEGRIFTNVSKAYVTIKRLFDIISALTGIIIFSPLLIMTTIAIKIHSPGPVIHIQERYGFKGKIFKDYRFCTTINADSNSKKRAGIKNNLILKKIGIELNSWFTRVIGLICRCRIDRLPRFFNVLMGDMSMVGPRAPLITEISKYDAWHNLRFSVKPGITGPWQISGRMNTDFEDMIRLDLKYIRERNFRYDLGILLKTMPYLFYGKNLSNEPKTGSRG